MSGGDGRFTRAYVLRWLQGVHYDFNKGIKALEEHFAWRLNNVPKQITSQI